MSCIDIIRNIHCIVAIHFEVPDKDYARIMREFAASKPWIESGRILLPLIGWLKICRNKNLLRAG